MQPAPVKRKVRGEPKVRYTGPDRYIDESGYACVRVERDGRRYFDAEHRVVMERLLGRPLVKGENVHHRNGVRDDNRPQNLELWWRPQPAGQRVADLLDYMVEQHADTLLARLLGDQEAAS